MLIEIPNENSIVKWKNDEKDEWKVAEISDLIKAYERPKKEIVPVCKVTFDKEQLQEIVDKKVAEMIERPQGEWVPVSERLPEEKINPYTTDFDEVLCTTDWGDVQAFKFGTPILHHKPHFWLGGAIMDEHIIAWQYKPEPYTEKKNTNFYIKRFNEVN